MYEIGTEVIYRGSIERFHNVIFTVVWHCCGGTRYVLEGYAEPTTLRHVRPASVTTQDDRERARRADLVRAVTDERPVEIAYIAADGEWTMRVIEPYEIADTRAGHEIVRAMDRRSGEPRSFRLDRILALTVVLGPFELTRPEPGAVRAVHPVDPVDAILARIRAEIAEIDSGGYCGDAARWTPGDPIV